VINVMGVLLKIQDGTDEVLEIKDDSTLVSFLGFHTLACENIIMTCIVGIIDKENKRVIIGGDSAGVGGYDTWIRKDAKVFKVKKFIIGGTSSFRMLQLLRFSFKPPKRKKRVYEYMCTDFVNELRKCLKKGGYARVDSNEESGGTFLVGYKGRLFRIEGDFQVGESVDAFDACGGGQSYALGSLETSTGNAVDRVTKALEVAEKRSAGVAGPFELLTNDYE